MSWTLSRLRARLEELGIRPSRGMGQNFLVDPNFVQFLLREARVGPADRVLEVGPGPGVLTPALAQAAGRVLAVELDARLAELCREELAGAANVEVLVADVLEGKHHLNPAVLERLAAGDGAGPIRLISNLPYAVATPVVLNLLESGLPVGEGLVTVQKEIAERWCAHPGSAKYGAPSVLVQLLCIPETVRLVPPEVFWPAPRVRSAVVRLRPRPEAHPDAGYRRTATWVRAAFAQRRKALPRRLAAVAELGVDEAEVVRRLAALGKPADVRPEQLTAEEFARLGGGETG